MYSNVVPAVLNGIHPAVIPALGYYRGGRVIYQAGMTVLPSYITFTRASSATDYNDPGLSYGTDAPVLSSDGWLTQGARTNLLLNSNNFTATGWNTKINGTGIAPVITPAFATSPDGTMNATRLQCNRGAGNTSADWSYLLGTVSGVGNPHDCALSIWMKSNTGVNQNVMLRNTSGTGTTNVTVTSEWQRFETYGSVSNLNGNMQIGTRGTISTDNSVDILIYGAQFEKDTFASSYIPTTGTAATRAADVATINNLASIGFNATQGTFFVEYSVLGVSGLQWLLQVDNNTSNERYTFRLSSGVLAAQVVTGGISQASFDLNASVIPKTVYKDAFSYKANNFAGVENGGTVQTDATGNLPTVDTMRFGDATTSAPLFGYIRRLIYYPTSLSNTQIQAMTV